MASARTGKGALQLKSLTPAKARSLARRSAEVRSMNKASSAVPF
jgi:hypothetical protein